MERSPSSLSLLLFVALAQTFAYFIPAATWSPMSRLAATQALVEHGSFAIGDYATATGDRARRAGIWYSDKAPLPALGATPAYAGLRWIHRVLGRDAPRFVAHDEQGVVARRLEVSVELAQLLYVCSLSTAGLAGAIVGLLIHRLVARRYDAQTAVVAAMVTMLGTPLFAYSTSFYGHVPAAAALTAALVLLDRERLDTRALVAIGALLGTAVGCEYLTALPAAVIGLGVLHHERARPWRALGAIGLGATLPIGIVGAVHTVCFGAPLRTGYAFLTNPTFVRGHRNGFLGLGMPSMEAIGGLLVGERRGLLRIAPVTLLALIGLAIGWRQRRSDRVLRVGSLALLALFVANASYYMWWGGAATGPRHLVPMLPVLGLGIAEVWQLRRGRPWVLGLGLVSIAFVFALVSVGIEAPEHGDAVFDYALPELARGHVASLRGASNLGLRMGMPTVASLAPLVAFHILATRMFVRILGEESLAVGQGSAQRPEVGASSAAS